MSEPLITVATIDAVNASAAAPASTTPAPAAPPAAAAPVVAPAPAQPAAAPAAPQTVTLETAKLEKPTALNFAETAPDGKTPEQRASEAEAAKADRQKGMTPQQIAADNAKAAEDAANAVVPADGKYTLKFPEGTTLTEAQNTAVQKFLADNKLTVGAANQMAELGAGLIKEVQAETAKATGDKFIENWKATVAANEKLIKEHPEYGGAKFEESKATAQRAVRVLGSEALVKMLNDGLGNDPHIFEFFVKTGRLISESKNVQVSPDNGKAPRFEDQWFGGDVARIAQEQGR